MMSQSISDKSVISTANVCLGSAGKKVTAGMRCVNDSNKSLNIHQYKWQGGSKRESPEMNW